MNYLQRILKKNQQQTINTTVNQLWIQEIYDIALKKDSLSPYIFRYSAGTWTSKSEVVVSEPLIYCGTTSPWVEALEIVRSKRVLTRRVGTFRLWSSSPLQNKFREITHDVL